MDGWRAGRAAGGSGLHPRGADDGLGLCLAPAKVVFMVSFLDEGGCCDFRSGEQAEEDGAEREGELHGGNECGEGVNGILKDGDRRGLNSPQTFGSKWPSPEKLRWRPKLES